MRWLVIIIAIIVFLLVWMFKSRQTQQETLAIQTIPILSLKLSDTVNSVTTCISKDKLVQLKTDYEKLQLTIKTLSSSIFSTKQVIDDLNKLSTQYKTTIDNLSTLSYCENPMDCIVSTTPIQITDCSVTCGTGTTTWRYGVIQPATGGGNCSTDLERTFTQPCYRGENLMDCIVSTTPTQITDCSVTCGTGTTTWRYGVIQPATCGGNCSTDLERTFTQPCYRGECPVDCIHDTTPINIDNCSVTCGTGVQSYLYPVVAEAEYGGSCDVPIYTRPCYIQYCYNVQPAECEDGYELIRASKISTGPGTLGIIQEDNSLWIMGSGLPLRRVGTNNNFEIVSAGNTHILAIDSDGKIVSYGGANNYGELGNGDIYGEMGPFTIGGKWKYVEAGDHASFAIDENDKLWVWGNNHSIPANEEALLPIPILPDDTWKSVSSGPDYTLGIKLNGTLWAWGNNSYGKLGDGTTKDRIVPVKISDRQWKTVVAGYFHSVGITEDNSLWTWGLNESGQLGDGSKENKYIPTLINPRVDRIWLKILPHFNSTIALTDNGELWGWGNNRFLQLDQTESESSVLIPTLCRTTGWVDVGVYQYATAALRDDGTIWAWGFNDNGCMGDTIERSVPTKLMVACR